MYGLFSLYSPFCPYLWQDRRTRGKATSSSIERAVKKRKANTSQIVKKGKGKRKGSLSEIEEESESKEEEIEAMFTESS